MSEVETDGVAAATPISLTIVTGMSGAGRSTAANALEDLGWFVVDNLPPALLPPLVQLGERTRGSVLNMAAVVDVRSGALLRDPARRIDRAGVP